MKVKRVLGPPVSGRLHWSCAAGAVLQDHTPDEKGLKKGASTSSLGPKCRSSSLRAAAAAEFAGPKLLHDTAVAGS